MFIPLVKTVTCLHLTKRELGKFGPTVFIGKGGSLDFSEHLAASAAQLNKVFFFFPGHWHRVYRINKKLKRSSENAKMSDVMNFFVEKI